MMRTKYCGMFRPADVGQTATACGWVLARRDMGGVIFIDLRDREGVLQVVCDASRLTSEDFRLAEGVHAQAVLRVEGMMRLRDKDTRNNRLPTGQVELAATRLVLLSDADPLPFPLEDAGRVREELRLAYRYLDLRRPEALDALRLRHATQRAAEAYLCDKGFIAVETPQLTRSTPEGARDYLVPSRVHPGKFYALPQAPQLFKQMLMVGGVDRYYQFARCFRDEDLRADRQPEFTQLDVEMSFVEQEDVLALLEGLFAHVMYAVKGVDVALPLRRMAWREAMDTYGSDKPDLRFDLPIIDVTDIASQSEFGVFKGACKAGGVVRAINATGCGDLPRGAIDALGEQAVQFGAKGMAWIALRGDGSVSTILTKYFAQAQMDALLARVQAKPGDLIVFGADTLDVVRQTMGRLRLHLGDMLGLRQKDAFAPLLVTDFPLLAFDTQSGQYAPVHHPFTMPHPDDVALLDTDPGHVRALAYDLVLNGVEVGGGSIRIHDAALQGHIFDLLGFAPEEAQRRFGFLLRAFRYGTPPHGGFALGFDRLVMLLAGADSLRDVISFPKLRDGSCPLTEAPTTVDPEQLEVLSLMRDEMRSPGPKAPPPMNTERTARLARLHLTEAEAAQLPGQLAEIVAFADALRAVDTEGVPEMAAPGGLHDVLRADAPRPSLARAEALDAAPSVEDGLITVPRTVG